MHATPARKVSNRTSWPPSSPAPGSLRHCARVDAPFRGCYPTSRRVASRPRGSPADSGLLGSLSSCRPVRARSARYPCPFRQDRAPWPPSLLRQVPTRGRRASSSFPAVTRFPNEASFSSRLPTLKWASLRKSRGRSSTTYSGVHATPARKVSNRTSWPPPSQHQESHRIESHPQAP